jgi:hypothetical protein
MTAASKPPPRVRLRLNQALWFVGLWCASVLALGVASGAMKLLFGAILK